MADRGSMTVSPRAWHIAAFAWVLSGFAAYTAVRWQRIRGWSAVPCEVVFSMRRDLNGPNPYRFDVAYRYEWAGRRYEGWTDRDSDSSHGTDDLAEVERLVMAYPTGARRVCYVNPGKPSEAVLRHDDPRLAAALAVALALFGLCAVTLRGQDTRSPGPAGGLFLLTVGLGGWVFLFLAPLASGLRTGGWKATPCVVESAGVRIDPRRSMGPFKCHREEVVYRYRVGGVAYRSNTVNRTDVGSPWPYPARRFVRRHPPGSAATCYVDPDDPSQAVLSRGVSETQWFAIWPLFLAWLGGSEFARSWAGRCQAIRGRKPGASLSWGMVALWAATTAAVDALWVTGSDVVADVREGVAEWPEFAAAGVAGVAAVALLAVWVARALDRSRTPAHPPDAGGVWYREADALPS